GQYFNYDPLVCPGPSGWHPPGCISSGGGSVPASRPRRDQRRARRSRERTAAIVLIVDDTADVRELYSEYLTARGFRVATASDGDSGIAAALRYHPDVIVMALAT